MLRFRMPKKALLALLSLCCLVCYACVPVSAVPHEQTPAPYASAPEPDSSSFAVRASSLEDFYLTRFGSQFAARTYADLSGDGKDELIVLQMNGKDGTILPAADAVECASDFYGGLVRVYALVNGEVFPIYYFSVAPGEYGQLYLYTEPGTGECSLLEYTARIQEGVNELSYRILRFDDGHPASLKSGDWSQNVWESASVSFKEARDENGQPAYTVLASDALPDAGNPQTLLRTMPRTVWEYLRTSEPLLVYDEAGGDTAFGYLGQRMNDRVLRADFDGDGVLDRADLSPVVSENMAFLSVMLSGGGGYSERLDMPAQDARLSLSAGDVTGDDRPELLACASGGASPYGSAAVFTLTQKGLLRLNADYAPRDAAHLTFISSYGDGDTIYGARIVHTEQGDALRVKIPISFGMDPAQYADARYENGAWRIVGEGFTYEAEGVYLPYLSYIPLALPSFGEDAYARAGYRAPNVKFVPKYIYEGFDENERAYDPELRVIKPSAREISSFAMRFLYELCGFQPETMYAGSTIYSLFFSQYPDKLLSKSFFSVNLGEPYGAQGIASYNWGHSTANPDSPIDPNAPGFLKPHGVADREVIALWYYARLPLPGKQEVVRTDLPYEGCVRLYFENGGCFDVYFDDELNLPNAFYGPYEQTPTH